jgi:hypothetical protein
MILALGLATTGSLMTMKIFKEVFEEIHELLANAFVVAAILHVSGIILHTFRYQDGIGMSMLHGRKSIETPNDSEISHSYRLVGVIFVVMFLGFVVYLNNNYDRQKQSLTIFNKTLQLGEAEKNENEHNEREQKHDDE